MLVHHFEPTFGLYKRTLIFAFVIVVSAVLNTHAFTIDAQKLARGGYSSSGLIPFPRTGRSAESLPATAADTADTDLIRNYFGQRQTDGVLSDGKPGQAFKPLNSSQTKVDQAPATTGDQQKKPKVGSKTKRAAVSHFKAAADKKRPKRGAVDTGDAFNVDTDDLMNVEKNFLRIARSENVFNQPRVDRSSWQVPYPRMGKKSVGSMIPMARLGRSSNMIPMARLGRSSNMIPMARLGRSSNMIPMARLGRSSNLVIPMARMGRSSTPDRSMIPMARLGRSVPEEFDGKEKEEMVPLYLPKGSFHPELNLQQILSTDSNDYENLMELLDEYLRIFDADLSMKLAQEKLSKEMMESKDEQ